MVVGVGATAMFHLESILHVNATYMYGLALTEGADDGSGTDFIEAYAGIPLVNWQGTSNVSIPLNAWTIGDYQIVEYTNREVPTHESIVVEGGALIGESVFSVPDSMGNAVVSDPLVANFAVGARYIYFWNLGDETMTIKNYSQFWVHMLLGPVGHVSGNDVTLVSGGFLGSDPEEHSVRTVGFKAGFSGPVWANGFATIDIELGYLPGGGGWFFGFGNTFPIFIL
jgi:hypothetical protein